MIDKHILKDQDKIILSEIPKIPDEFTNEDYVKMIIPKEYINYETGVFELKDFINNIRNETIEFEYTPKRNYCPHCDSELLR